MEKYIGKRTISATPMNAHGAEAVLNKKIVLNDEKLSGEGYLVESANGSMSWMPKETFERSWEKAEAFLDRLIIEMNDLTEKMEKLSDFIEKNDVFSKLGEKEKGLLEDQLRYMCKYRDCLEERSIIYQTKTK